MFNKGLHWEEFYLLRGTEQFQRPVCHLLDDLKMGHLGTHYQRPQWPLIESHPGECWNC